MERMSVWAESGPRPSSPRWRCSSPSWPTACWATRPAHRPGRAPRTGRPVEPGRQLVDGHPARRLRPRLRARRRADLASRLRARARARRGPRPGPRAVPPPPRPGRAAQHVVRAGPRRASSWHRPRCSPSTRWRAHWRFSERHAPRAGAGGRARRGQRRRAAGGTRRTAWPWRSWCGPRWRWSATARPARRAPPSCSVWASPSSRSPSSAWRRCWRRLAWRDAARLSWRLVAAELVVVLPPLVAETAPHAVRAGAPAVPARLHLVHPADPPGAASSARGSTVAGRPGWWPSCSSAALAVAVCRRRHDLADRAHHDRGRLLPPRPARDRAQLVLPLAGPGAVPAARAAAQRDAVRAVQRRPRRQHGVGTAGCTTSRCGGRP